MNALTVDTCEYLFSRTNTRTSTTVADSFYNWNIKDTSVQNGAGGTLTSDKAVVKVESVATQTAGTLTHTKDVYNATQSATVTTGKLFTGVVGSTERFKVHPMVANSGTNNAYLFDTTTSLSGTTTLAVFANAGTTKLTINYDGSIVPNALTSMAPGYINIPQNSQSAAYTTVAADAGKHILHPASDNNARTFTIDSNANVAYPIGTTITFINQINTVTIAITSDTLTLMGAGSTGSRTLAANGIATAVKVASTSWIINGTNLT